VLKQPGPLTDEMSGCTTPVALRGKQWAVHPFHYLAAVHDQPGRGRTRGETAPGAFGGLGPERRLRLPLVST
jgi:hypothetical protein